MQSAYPPVTTILAVSGFRRMPCLRASVPCQRGPGRTARSRGDTVRRPRGGVPRFNRGARPSTVEIPGRADGSQARLLRALGGVRHERPMGRPAGQGRGGGPSAARVRARTRVAMTGHPTVELGNASAQDREPRASLLRSVGFELVGFAAVLGIVAATVGSGAFKLAARPMDPPSIVARIDTDTTHHAPGAATHKTAHGGDAPLSPDSLAKRRDAAAHAPQARADSATRHGAPPPSAVVP